MTKPTFSDAVLFGRSRGLVMAAASSTMLYQTAMKSVPVSSQTTAAIIAAATPPSQPTPSSLLLHQCVARGDADQVSSVVRKHVSK
jgi:hypothetical protein